MERRVEPLRSWPLQIAKKAVGCVSVVFWFRGDLRDVSENNRRQNPHNSNVPRGTSRAVFATLPFRIFSERSDTLGGRPRSMSCAQYGESPQKRGGGERRVEENANPSERILSQMGVLVRSIKRRIIHQSVPTPQHKPKQPRYNFTA